MTKIEAAVQSLVAKAAATEDSSDAMRFSQAAQNAANAERTLIDTKEQRLVSRHRAR